MSVSSVARPLAGIVFAAVVAAGASVPVIAQADHSHQAAGKTDQAAALVKVVRDATERFRDVSVAEAEGYALQFGCVSGSDAGAMGMHFEKGELVGDDVIDATRPEIVIYEPQPDGRLKLIGADFLVLKDGWEASHAASSWCGVTGGPRATPPRRSSWGSSSTCSTRRTASGCRRSTRCTSGRGRTTRMAHSRPGTRTPRANPSGAPAS